MYILVLKYAFLRVSVAIDALMLSPQMETVVCSFSPGGDGQVWLLCATKPVPEATGTKVTPGTLTWVLQLVFQLGMEPVPIAVVLLGQRLKACSWKNKLPSKSASIVGWLQELRWGRGYTLALKFWKNPDCTSKRWWLWYLWALRLSPCAGFGWHVELILFWVAGVICVWDLCWEHCWQHRDVSVLAKQDLHEAFSSPHPIPPVRRPGMRRELREDTARTDLTPEGCPRPYGSCSAYLLGGRRRMFAVMVFVFPGQHYVWQDLSLLLEVLKTCLSQHVGNELLVLFCLLYLFKCHCLNPRVFSLFWFSCRSQQGTMSKWLCGADWA